MLRIKWTDVALEDMNDSLEYIADVKKNPIAASRIASRIDETATLLRESPELGIQGRYPGTMEKVVISTNYTLWYRHDEKTVEILRVMHQLRKWPQSLPRR